MDYPRTSAGMTLCGESNLLAIGRVTKFVLATGIPFLVRLGL